MKLRNQKGFSVIELLLILIVLSVIGFTGYRVYRAKQIADKSLASSQQASEQTVSRGNTTMETETTENPSANNDETTTFSEQKFESTEAVATAYCEEEGLSCSITKLYEGTTPANGDFLLKDMHGAIHDLGTQNFWLITWRNDDKWVLSMVTSQGCDTGTDQPTLVSYCQSL